MSYQERYGADEIKCVVCKHYQKSRYQPPTPAAKSRILITKLGQTCSDCIMKLEIEDPIFALGLGVTK